MLKKLTPVLFVERVEDQLPFWIDTLGFTKTVEVPHDGALGFAILVKDQVEVMVQSYASVAADVAALAGTHTLSALFLETDDIDGIEKRVAKLPKVFPRRTTFYGATEIAVRDPAGNIVTFAQFGA